MKADITEKNYMITKIINVLSTRLTKNRKIFVNGRHSDALIFITHGSCTYNFPNESRSITASEGDILYLSRSEVYTMDIHSINYKSIYCDFEFENSAEHKSDVYPLKNKSKGENLFLKLINTYKLSTSVSALECMSILYEIYAFLTSETKSQEPVTVYSKIEKAKNIIDTSFGDVNLSVSYLAGNVGISEVYFRKLFKNQYGISPLEYIKSTRITEAKKLLKYTFLTLDECSVKCGFSSVQYFCKDFKSATGMTPHKFRQR